KGGRQVTNTGNGCCCGCSCSVASTQSKEVKRFSFKRAVEYGFGTLFRETAEPLFWGILIGSLLTTFIPQGVEDFLKENILFSYILMLIVAVPMYVCATSSLPIGASFLLAGVPAGAVFVFLTAGPATNAVTIGVVNKVLGRKTLFIYLFTVIVGSVLFGLFLDQLFEMSRIDPQEIVHLGGSTDPIKLFFTFVFFILLFKNLWRLKIKSPEGT
ncbi:MAG: permease, partial [Desulfurobacterium sp.]